MQARTLVVVAICSTFLVSCAKFEFGKESELAAVAALRVKTVKWDASKEAAVNSPGGGYKVTYSKGSTIDSNAKVIDIPFKSGSALETSVAIPFPSPGQYRVRITAYSSLNPAGSSTEVDYNVKQ